MLQLTIDYCYSLFSDSKLYNNVLSNHIVIYIIYIIHYLNFFAEITDFISAPTLLDVINKMEEKTTLTNGHALIKSEQKYTSKLLEEKYKKDVFE